MRFSIIVPVYNIRLFLPQCVESILAQTWKDYELILVDDGSTDGSEKLCDTYREKDERIQVIHKSNGGLVSARQEGVQAALGKYIIHVDGDDWIQPQMLEKANELIQLYDADMICFGAERVFPDRSEFLQEPVPEGLYTGSKLKERIYPKVLMDCDMIHMMYYLWAKVIRRELLFPHQMNVSRQISNGEDIICVAPVYRNAKSVYISHQNLYCYRCREGSISHGFQGKMFPKSCILLKEFAKLSQDWESEFKEQLSRYSLWTFFNLMVAMAAAKGRKDLPLARQYRMQEEFDISINEARFRKVTPKTKISFFLIKKGKLSFTYVFLRICGVLKRKRK